MSAKVHEAITEVLQLIFQFTIAVLGVVSLTAWTSKETEIY
jgi:hypothetical protein